MNVTKQDIVKSISKKCGYTQKEVKEIIEETLGIITEEMSKGNRVVFQGFGAFATKERSERKGRNVTTGEEIIVPKKTVPVFKAGIKLKESIDKGGK